MRAKLEKLQGAIQKGVHETPDANFTGGVHENFAGL
jgi:hypothetical protein